MFENNFVVKILVLTFVIFATSTTNGFNLSPKPNLILKEPNYDVFVNKTKSSYFGFTINLRKSSVIVGAPRALSTLESQNQYETGAIYKCNITNGTCEPLVFDDTGNTWHNISSKSLLEEKQYQWLGASMDGGCEDTDILVVCAPRIRFVSGTQIHINGICYWIPNTIDKTTNVTKITALYYEKQYRIINGEIIFNYIYGEQGISVHITTNSEQIIMGAPGIFKSRGSIVRYLPNVKNAITELSRKSSNIDSNTVVPDPNLWNQFNESYFGYSVGSGYFDGDLPNKIQYVASATKANDMWGEVYIFDIIENAQGNSHNITKLFTFRGTNFLEYFGCAVLAEDINGDELTDLIITAPLYSSNGYLEQGAIYVFVNKGKMAFELQRIIESPVEDNGRFGTSISKLGDINRDGFNDVAVGAPFAGNGTVYIYLGCSEGLREEPSQQLSAGPVASFWDQRIMFGLGLSKGCDIDKNDFNDLAVGAPNAESVFVYRAYPVVKIHVNLKPLSRLIEYNEETLKIEICYKISTVSQKVKSQEITMSLKVDEQFKRLQFEQSNSYTLILNVTAREDDQCQVLDANVKSRTNLLEAIEIEMHYGLINGIPDDEEFCNECAAVDPTDPKVKNDKIKFSTGCNSVICTTDLKVTGSEVSQTFILGSDKTISVTYEITNSGETAYQPQINITSSGQLSFYKIPPSCILHEHVLLCDLNQGQSISTNNKANITITYYVSKIEGSSVSLTASVFSCCQDKNLSDDKVINTIMFQEFTEIEAHRKTNVTNIELKGEFNSTEIIKTYEVKSMGPSDIKELEIAFEIPIAFKFFGLLQPVPVIDVNNITVEGIYNGQLLSANFYQVHDRNLLPANLTEKAAQASVTIKGVLSTKQEAFIRLSQKELEEFHQRELSGLVQINRTMVFSCKDPRMTTCVKAAIKVNNCTPYSAVNITLKYNVNLSQVNEALIEPFESFVIITKMDIFKLGDLDGKTINISGLSEFIDVSVSKYKSYDVIIPWKAVLLAIFDGILILGVLVYGMQKVGFFKRKMKEKIEKIVREERRRTLKVTIKRKEEE